MATVNLFDRFLGLLPTRALKVGTATGQNGPYAVLTTPEGGTTQVLRGDLTVTIGQKYFYEAGGSLQGEAPNLTAINVTV